MSDMDLLRYKESTNQPDTPRAISDADRDALLNTMKIEPTNPLQLMNPLYKFDAAIGRAAMEIAGPGKFKSALKLIPLTVDKGRNIASLIKFDDQLMKLNPTERKELATLALPRLREGLDKIDSVYKSDVMGNKKATASLISDLDLNKQDYGSLLRKIQSIVDGTYKPMNTGGIATLMPNNG